MSLRLDWCSHAAAEYAVSHWHYSHSLPPPPHNRIGVWEGGAFIGVVLFARGASPHLLRPFGLRMTEGCELVRVALHHHTAPVSRIVTIAVRFLRQQSPGMRIIVSYADPNHGHTGGIYQAMGWTYLGMTAPTKEYISPDGKHWHSRMISASGVRRVYGHARRVLRPDQCAIFERSGKHRYALPLDAAMRAQLVTLARPYPKRGRSAENGTAAPTAGAGINSEPPAPTI